MCTGNLCRSPMAEGLVDARIRARGLADAIEVTSAGTWTTEGEPPSSHAVTAMSERSIDIGAIRSHEVAAADVAAADLVLVMTAGHQQSLVAEFPGARAKIRLMSELDGGMWDIADPIGGELDDYRATADELERLVEAGWEIIAGS